MNTVWQFSEADNDDDDDDSGHPGSACLDSAMVKCAGASSMCWPLALVATTARKHEKTTHTVEREDKHGDADRDNEDSQWRQWLHSNGMLAANCCSSSINCLAGLVRPTNQPHSFLLFVRLYITTGRKWQFRWLSHSSYTGDSTHNGIVFSAMNRTEPVAPSWWICDRRRRAPETAEQCAHRNHHPVTFTHSVYCGHLQRRRGALIGETDKMFRSEEKETGERNCTWKLGREKETREKKIMQTMQKTHWISLSLKDGQKRQLSFINVLQTRWVVPALLLQHS